MKECPRCHGKCQVEGEGWTEQCCPDCKGEGYLYTVDELNKMEESK